MLNLGLTGGIGSGKSAVSTVLAELGATIVDADKIAREVVEPGTDGLQRIVAEFGDRLLTEQGALDRPALAEIVFNDEPSRLRLNAIVHPLVRARSEELVRAAGRDGIVVHDIPLLAEGNGAASFHLVLVVSTPEEIRLQRLTQQRGMTREDAVARIAAQATEQQRLAIADVVLDNSGTPADLRAQLQRHWAQRLSPYAEALARRSAADESVDARDGAQQREQARLAWALAQVDVAAPRIADGTALVNGDDERVRGALEAAGWFGDEVLRTADPGGSLRVALVGSDDL